MCRLTIAGPAAVSFTFLNLLYCAASDPLVVGRRDSVPMCLNIVFDPLGDKMATGHFPNGICLWSTKTGSLLERYSGHESFVRALAFAPTGSELASGGNDRIIRIWNPVTKKPLRSLNGHTDCVTSLAYTPDGTRLVSAGHDRKVCLWEVSTGKLLAANDSAVKIDTVCVLPDGKLIAMGGEDGITDNCAANASGFFTPPGSNRFLSQRRSTASCCVSGS
jgi:WD40 repeat protein